MKIHNVLLNKLQRSLLLKCLLLCLLALPVNIMAETIAVIGTGKVGSALGPRFASLGHTVVYGSRSPEREDVQELVKKSGKLSSAMTPLDAAQIADIVLIAVPWDVAEEVVIGLGDLSGKIIIDPINPRLVDDEGFQGYPTYTSNLERIQNLAPQAKVVKAFSTISSTMMIDPKLADHPITIPLAGNDADAKKIVAELCEKLGFEAMDFGAAKFAHIIEGLYLLRINARRKNDEYFEWHFAPSKR